MIEEINQKFYGGGCAFVSDCLLDELKSMCKEIVMKGNLNNAFDKASYPLDTWDNTFYSRNLKVIGAFNLCSEGGSFLFKFFFHHMSQHYSNFLN